RLPQPLAVTQVVGGYADLDNRPGDRSQAPPSNAIRSHALSAVDSPEGQTEQQVDQLPRQRPPPRPASSGPSNGFSQRVKSVPTLPVLEEQVIPADRAQDQYPGVRDLLDGLGHFAPCGIPRFVGVPQAFLRK